MGRNLTAKTGLAQALFSQVQLRVLHLLFGQPDQQFNGSQIIQLARSGSGAVQRELGKLTKAGLLIMTVSGNQKLYQANRQSPIFEEIHGLILKTVGLLEPLRSALKALSPGIRVAFVYGSVAKEQDTAKSDIDLMIIGSGLAYSEVYAALQKAEKVLRRPVNPNLMTTNEWKRKLAHRNPFLSKVIQQPKLFVFGTENELQAIGQPGPSGQPQGGARGSEGI